MGSSEYRSVEYHKSSIIKGISLFRINTQMAVTAIRIRLIDAIVPVLFFIIKIIR